MTEINETQWKISEDVSIEELNEGLLELKRELKNLYEQEELTERKLRAVEECLRDRVSELETSIRFDADDWFNIKRDESCESRKSWKDEHITLHGISPLILGYIFVGICSAITLAALLKGY